MLSTKKRSKAPASGYVRRDPLASLRVADILVTSKPVLPLEIIADIVNHLSPPDLIRFARVSRRMQEMIYDDTRWVQMLQRMGCWKESEARKRVESQRTQPTSQRRQSTIDRQLVNGKGRPVNRAQIVNGAVSQEVLWEAQPTSITSPPAKLLSDLNGQHDIRSVGNDANKNSSKEYALTALAQVQSIRGKARQEYGKVYHALGRFYNDLLTSREPMKSMIFRAYSLPQQQAQMLAQIRIFAKSDISPGSVSREVHIVEAMNVFDTAALLEFRQGYEYKDIQGRMKEYAQVMYTLNGGKSSLDLFLHDNRLVSQKSSLGSASDCVEYSLGYGQLSLQRAQSYFDRLADAYSQEVAIIDAAFPNPIAVRIVFLRKVGKDVLAPYLTSLFDEARNRGVSIYLRIVSGSFAQTQHFIENYAFTTPQDITIQKVIVEVLCEIFGSHLDVYLAEELATFQQKAESDVDQWDRALLDQATSTETFLMSNLSRHAAKKDFMSSFKKVVMMPVNILPSFSSSSASKATPKTNLNGLTEYSSSNAPSRSSTPAPGSRVTSTSRARSPGPQEAPTTELAAKAALMNSKLEGIRSLFSIEVALNLVHAAKSSLERAAQFIVLGQPLGDTARTQCAAIFIYLVQTIGSRHVQAGFDKAIEALSAYDPRQTTSASDTLSSPHVAPLATFLELVNVGDLIQQMLDVFYESELVRLRISNRDDFLDPSLKGKKKFEAMLDERVAAGLSKGIDVLMDEVEYICATTQLATDFQPLSDSSSIVDIGPTSTAITVVDLVETHTSMLTGATDKSLLDVFTGEVGLRLFQNLTKHLKRQRISESGALALLSDLTLYSKFIATFKNPDLNNYFAALRALAQIYLIDGRAKGAAEGMATIISDGERYKGIFTVEEVIEFAERRSDWLTGGVKVKVEKALYGRECSVM